LKHFQIIFHALLFTCIHFFNREYVVDLVGEPGNVHGPDSSINGGLLSSMPSPFKICHLKEFQQPHVDVASSCQILNSEHMCDPPKNPLYSGKLRFVYFGSLFLFFIFNKPSVKGQLIELWRRHKCNLYGHLEMCGSG
jgi:hypothetical protein